MPSARFIAAVTAQNSADCPVFLLTIDHADFPAPLRYCTGGADIESNGETFKGRAMKVSPPGEGADANARRGRAALDNVDKDAVGQLRLAVVDRPTASIGVILAAYPDDVEAEWSGLELSDMRFSGPSIDLEFSDRDDAAETWPLQAFSPRRTPGLFD